MQLTRALRSLIVTLILTTVSTGSAAEKLRVVVSEPAGIRRYQYPVATPLAPLDAANDAIHLRLLDDKGPRPAQFRRVVSPDGSGRWWADFNVDLLPYESRELTIEYGPDVQADSEPKSGWRLEESDQEFRLTNGTSIVWRIRREPKDWLSSVRVPDFEYLREQGAVFEVLGSDGQRHALGTGSNEKRAARVVRSGPLAIACEYDVTISEGPHTRLQSRITLTFPLAKSWVEVDWSIRDPQKSVQSLAAEVVINANEATSAPTMVDFGASNLVYLTLGKNQSAELRSLRIDKSANTDRSLSAWEVLRGSPDKLEPYVSGRRLDRSPDGHHNSDRAEGWVHLMDRTRCLAAAVADFGGGDLLRVTDSGRLTIQRLASEKSATEQTLRFWMHFIPFPPQHTAVTSPQSMQNPPVVMVEKK